MLVKNAKRMASTSGCHIGLSCIMFGMLLACFYADPSLCSSDPDWTDDTPFEYDTIDGQENVLSKEDSRLTDTSSHEINSQPGMKLQLSNALLNTLTTYASNKIFSRVTGMTLPDQRGRAGSVKYEFSEMKVVEFTKPSTSASINPGSGLTITAQGAQIKINGRFMVKKWIKLRGTFDLFIQFNFVTLSFALGADPSGHPTIWSTACQSQIDTVTIKFRGGVSWIVSLFKRKIVRAIKNDVSSIACKLARDGIDVSARAELAILPVQYQFLVLSGMLNFDYRLWAPPSFDKRGFVETLHKAEVFQAGDSVEAPFQADVLPDPGAVDQMVSLWVSEYTFNSAAYSLYRLGLLQRTILSTDLPPAHQGFFDTTCKQGVCFGGRPMFSNVGKLYPNSVVELAVSAANTPRLIISPTGVDCLFSVVISFDARLANNSLAHLFEVNFTATVLKVQVNVNGSSNVRFSVDEISEPTFVVLNSAVGEVSSHSLEFFFILATKSAIVPMINNFGGQGIPQIVKNWQLQNVGLNMDVHCVRFSTNIAPV